MGSRMATGADQRLVVKAGNPLTTWLPLSEGSKYRYRVLVFRSPTEMRRWYTRYRNHGEGSFSTASRLGRQGKSRTIGRAIYNRFGRKCGYILLCRDYCGVGVVAHEMTHAAYYAAHFLWPGPRSSGFDERQAYVCGYLVWRFWRWFYRQEREFR